MKTTLVTVSGISPAILTETLWALAVDKTFPCVPDEVVVITTRRGEEDIERLLLTPLPDWGDKTVWETLRADLLKKAKLPASHPCLQISLQVIDLPNPSTGIREKAHDIRSISDNAEAADFILRTLASHADAADTRVIASIAGGRKTMGALLYAAMTLVGKETDRVTHVLVSEPFETCRSFFYPGQPVQNLEAGPPGQSSAALAADAKIELADIPFVPLRNGFAELNEPRRSFGGLVTRYSHELSRPLGRKPTIALDVALATLTVEGVRISLTGIELLACAFLYLRCKEGKAPFHRQKAAEEPYFRFVNQWKKQYPSHRALERLHKQEPLLSDLTRALNSLRAKLKAKGLANTIPYLAPKSSRVGFEAQIL